MKYRTVAGVKQKNIILAYRSLLFKLRAGIGGKTEFGTPITQKLIDTIEKRYDELTTRQLRRY